MNNIYGVCKTLLGRTSVLGLSVFGAGTLTAGTGLADSSFGSAWRLTPSLEISETYTDNVELSETNKRSDLITTVTPGFNLSRIGGRLSVVADYRYAYYLSTTDKKFNQGRHSLSSLLNWALTDELSFNAGASIAQSFIDRRQARSGNDANFTTNRQPVHSYYAGPTYRTELGTIADLTLNYQFAYLHSENNGRTLTGASPFLEDTTTHAGSVVLDSGRRFGRLRWTLSGSLSKEYRKNSTDDRLTRSGNLNLEYAINRWLTPVGRAGYEDYGSSSLQNEPAGFFWDAGARLTPGPRTRVEGRIGRRYGGTTYYLDANYIIGPRTNFSVSYNEDISSAAREQLLALSSSRIDPTSVSIIPGVLYGTQVFQDNTYHIKTARANLSGSRGRTSFSLGAFLNRRRADNPLNVGDNQKGYGVDGSITRQLSPRATLSISGSYEPIEYDDGRTDKDFFANAEYSYKLFSNLNSSLTFVHSNRGSNFGQQGYTENAVTASLTYTF